MQKRATTYKIRQVADLTGASEFLLRTWEHRYAALTPVRTKTGRRLYTDSDILKARALLALTQKGCRVGDIAHKNLSELDQMIQNEMSIHPPEPSDLTIQKIMSKASAFEWQEVRKLVLQNQKLTGLNWIHHLIVPLLIEMGRQVDANNFSITQEHILSAIIKESLAHRLRVRKPLANGPRVVLAAPEGDFHDIGILIASHIAAELRVNTLFLGPHMPKNELAAVCLRYKATHLLLSSTTEPSKESPSYLSYVHFLDRNLNPKVTLWLAGRNAHQSPVSLQRPFKILDSFSTFESELKKCIK